MQQAPKEKMLPVRNWGLSKLWRFRTFYFMLIPGLIWYIMFKYAPMYGLIIAFKDFDIGKGILESGWADPWYKYFKQFYDSPYFNQVMGNTIIISLYKLVFGSIPPIIMAIMLHESRIKWLKNLIQTLSFMPHFLSWVIIYGMLLAFLSQNSGLINRWIVESGGAAIPFLSSTDWFRSILVSSEIWQNIGWGSIIYLAAMSGIDPTLYEAARVDGASRLRMIWHITLPGIRNVIFLLLILKVGHILDAGFDQIYILYNVQVYPVADIIDTWVFRTGLQQLSFSLAGAVGIIKSVIGLALVLGANKLAKMWGESVW